MNCPYQRVVLRLKATQPMQKFDYTLDFKTIDFRQQPELYRVGKGEHKSGRKYAKDSKIILPNQEDPIKAESAKIFDRVWQLAKIDPDYLVMLERHVLTISPSDGRSIPTSFG